VDQVFEPGVGHVTTLMERLRLVHERMLNAVLGAEGLQQVAALTAEAACAPVAIVVPQIDAVVAAGDEAQLPEQTLEDVRRYVSDCVRDRPARAPEALAAEVPIQTDDRLMGAVVLLHAAGSQPASDAASSLQLAAVASLTGVALEEAKTRVEERLRGSFMEDVRSGQITERREIARRAARLGCDLAHGAVVLCGELRSDRPRHVMAMITGEVPGALTQQIDGRIYAVVPRRPDEPGERAVARARTLAVRLRRHATVGFSSFYADPGELPRAIQEAELVLDVFAQDDGGWEGVEEIGTGTYRLLFRLLVSHPDEIQAFYEDTVGAIVRYDQQYQADLIWTLESYLKSNCNMNATAAEIFAHRHTVAYRLERVKLLTGLDPLISEDRERLGLGLKAYRVLAHRLRS
jgi:hypothetical protein